MVRHWLPILCLLTLSGCGVYLEYPPMGNNAQWKLMTDSDTAVYRLSKKAIIDSVINIDSKKVYYPSEADGFYLAGSQLNPGINELSLVFYSNGKKKRSYERLYMVSDLEPEQLTVEDYYLLKHDETAFTQGLLWKDGWLYESTGLVGQSSLRVINADNGDVIRRQSLDKNIFAEGISFVDEQLVLLTWKDGLVYKFNEALEQLGLYPYRREGWGLTTMEGHQLLSSDGSNSLHYLSTDYKIDSTFQVYNHRGPVHYLNELEYIEGKVWANVLGSDKVVVINPASGKVEVEIDLSSCIDRHRYPDAGVLNGIAYNPNTGAVYLTGKNWPYIIVWQYLLFDK